MGKVRVEETAILQTTPGCVTHEQGIISVASLLVQTFSVIYTKCINVLHVL